MRAGGFVLLGELGKYVSVSPARFSGVAVTAGGIAMAVTVHGAPGETVDVTALVPGGGQFAATVRVSRVTFKAGGPAQQVVEFKAG